MFHHAGAEGHLDGPAPQRRSYGTFASFCDPDGNGWFMQEVTSRLPGHVSTADATFSSPRELAGALRRAEASYEGRPTFLKDGNWPDWYAEYLVREQAGEELPQ